MTHVIVASLNPIKLAAVKRAFHDLFEDQSARFDTLSVPSGVADQPMTSEETLRGAQNRARAARISEPDADMWVGVEGGLESLPAGLAAFAWIVALGRERCGVGRTATFMVPPEVAAMVKAGVELGVANDRIFGRANSKQNEGAIGILSHGALDRAGLYAHGVLAALLPLRNPDWYPADR